MNDLWSRLSAFVSDRTGSTAAMAGIVLSAVVAATGGVVDYSRMVNARVDLQSAVDTAILGASRKATDADRKATFRSMLESNARLDGMFTLGDTDISFNQSRTALKATAEARVKLIFGSFAFLESTGDINADATVSLSNRRFEIALVVDVSSSMFEESRFEPAKNAVKAFIGRFEGTPDTSIALVPFSSRVNYGLRRQSLFGEWNGGDAIPDRWLSPDDHYNSNYTRLDWIDNQTFAMTRDNPIKRTDWMGCAEPRLDVSVERGDTEFVPSDSPPNLTPLVAMDHNPAPGKTFCPPPIESLTEDYSRLTRAADALTAQGSTRLDAGMEAAWNVLSPDWGTAWGTSNAPAAYEDGDTLKMIVFMTDGQMNTMRDPSNVYEYDWACKGSEDCDADATASLLATCEAIKDKGVEIHTISYDKDADTTAMRACASSGSMFQIAESETGNTFVETIYERIADRIISRRNVLTN